MSKSRRRGRISANINRDCVSCPLHKSAQNICSPGDGNPFSPLVLVGEAPGQREDDLDKPFQGRAGQTLNLALIAARIERSKIWITNAVRCRPPGNRTPEQSEIQACLPYLSVEFHVIRPRVIVPLGNTALWAVLGKWGISRYRGRKIWSNSWSALVIPTWHPSYVGRKQEAMGDLVDDLLKARKALRFYM